MELLIYICIDKYNSLITETRIHVSIVFSDSLLNNSKHSVSDKSQSYNYNISTCPNVLNDTSVTNNLYTILIIIHEQRKGLDIKDNALNNYICISVHF